MFNVDANIKITCAIKCAYQNSAIKITRIRVSPPVKAHKKKALNIIYLGYVHQKDNG